jgi:prophage regulatory protein
MSEFIRCRPLLAKTGLTKTTLYRLIGAGLFPSPIKITDRSSAWCAEEVEAWMLQKLSDRQQGMSLKIKRRAG